MNLKTYFYEPKALVPGNQANVLFGGKEIFPEFLGFIDQAKHRIHLQIYEFLDDALGQEVAKRLIAAAQRGCEVKLIYDYWGSFNASAHFFKRMQSFGIQVKCYHSLFSKNVGKKFFKRNHRKMLLVDAKQAIIGGFNIADVYRRKAHEGGIHDFAVKIVGPACAQAWCYFDEVWQAKPFQLKSWSKVIEKRKVVREYQGSQNIMVLGNNHWWNRLKIRRDFLHAFEQAKHSICIMNPYFIPDPAVIRSLLAAQKRGVQVTLILPQKSDVSFVDLASKVIVHKIIQSGIQVYRWPGFSHGKAICVDESWLSLGSYNFDYRSMLHNLELVVQTADETCVKDFDQFYKNELKKCTRVCQQEWRNLSYTTKLISRLFYRLRVWL